MFVLENYRQSSVNGGENGEEQRKGRSGQGIERQEKVGKEKEEEWGREGRGQSIWGYGKG